MPEKNKNQKPLDLLIGDYGRDTRIAKNLLDEVGIQYQFLPASAYEGILPQFWGGLCNKIGLDQIARMVKRYKQGRSLANSI